MYGLRGGSELFEGRGAHEMYAAALALTPGNTCAATHVAYGARWAAQHAESCAPPAVTADLDDADADDADDAYGVG
eukprot:5372987-Prymnesium_polylepis.3